LYCRRRDPSRALDLGGFVDGLVKSERGQVPVRLRLMAILHGWYSIGLCKYIMRIEEDFSTIPSQKELQKNMQTCLAAWRALLLIPRVRRVRCVVTTRGIGRRPVGSSHLPGRNRSRPAKLRERVVSRGTGAWCRGCLCASSLSRLRFLFSRRRCRGSRCRCGRFLSWLRCSWRRCRYRRFASPRGARSTAATQTVAQQDLEALQFRAKFPQPTLVAFPGAFKGLGDGVF
jgi:hypothetical protein